MRRRLRLLAAALPLALLAPAACGHDADGYAAMLEYLAQTRIQDQAFSGANGAIAANMAAGDLNQQANVRSIAVGAAAIATADARQRRHADTGATPEHAVATIEGNAFAGAGGLVSINQASGTANTEFNVVAATLAQQGIREATDDLLSSSSAFASAGPQHHGGSGATGTGTYSVAVDATALQGFEGVMQLNQIAGSGNATDNRLLMSVQTGP